MTSDATHDTPSDATRDRQADVQRFLSELATLSERYGLWLSSWSSDEPWLEDDEGEKVARDVRRFDASGVRAYAAYMADVEVDAETLHARELTIGPLTMFEPIERLADGSIVDHAFDPGPYRFVLRCQYQPQGPGTRICGNFESGHLTTVRENAGFLPQQPPSR